MAGQPERLTREQLRELAEASSDATFRGSLEGAITWISPSVTELIGWRPDDVIGQPFLSLVHPDDAAPIPRARAMADEGEPVRFRVRLRRSDGSHRWIDVLLRTSFDEHGLPRWRYGSWRDAEPEATQEQRLAAVADRGRRILDGMLDPWVVLSPVHDAQGHVVDLVFTEANARACEYNQVTYDELVGARLLELLPAHRGSDLYAGYLHTLETGEPLVLDDYVYPREIFGGADRRYDIRVVRIEDGLSFTWRDVTSRFEERVRLARSEARFAAALRSEIDPHVIFEAVRGSGEEILDLRYSEVNPAAASYLGSTVDHLQGSCLSTVRTPAFSEALTSLGAVIDSGVPLVLNSWVVDSIHGPQRILDLRAVKVGDGVSVIWRDITDEHMAHQRLADTEELLDASFAAELDGHVLLQAVRDRDGEILDFRVLRCNGVGAAYLGRSAPDTIGLMIREFAPAEAAERAIRQYATVVETGSPWVARKAADMPGAEGHWLDVHVVKSLDGVGVTFRDVTESVLAQQELAESEERFRLLSMNATEMIVLIRDHCVVWASPSAADFAHVDLDHLVGTDIRLSILPEDLEAFEAAYASASTGEELVARVRIRAADGAVHWIETHAGPYRGQDASHSGVLASARVVDDVVSMEQELEHRARFDFLTGLMNRSEVLRVVSRISTQHPRTGDLTAVLFCDVDHFKDINDTYGHAAGDHVLRTLGERLAGVIRADDYAARIGGDELLVVLAGVHDLDEATGIARKVRAAVADAINLSPDRQVHVSLSVGVALLRPGESTDLLLERADAAMYEAKRTGRDRIVAVA